MTTDERVNPAHERTKQSLRRMTLRAEAAERRAVAAEAAVGLALATFERLSNLWEGRETPETEYAMVEELNAALADARRAALPDSDAD